MPFKGQSTAQKEFVDRKKERVEKVLPFDMVSGAAKIIVVVLSNCRAGVLTLCYFDAQLVVPHGMSMPTKSEAR